jgi:HPr kinase/phosphorylase
MEKTIPVPEVHRPGLGLSGYLKGFHSKRILVFGKEEMSYLGDLSCDERKVRLAAILSPATPAIFLPRGQKPISEMSELAERFQIPLFRSSLPAVALLGKLGMILNEEFAPSSLCHGTLVEVFDLGVLMQGNSSVGKSETALGLIERGHRLVADDVVRVSKREGGDLEGTGTALTKHIMEIRGIGILNIAHLYGAVRVRESKTIDIVVYLEAWDDDHSYERIGLEEKSCDILGVAIPFYVLPVKPGRDVVLLLETIALNHRLKQMGIHSAREFTTKLRQQLSEKRKENKVCESGSKSASEKQLRDSYEASNSDCQTAPSGPLASLFSP